jgi:hypothetical protein
VDVGKLLLNYVLSDPYVDVALIGMRESRFASLNNAISDDVGSRIDLPSCTIGMSVEEKCAHPRTAELACAHGLKRDPEGRYATL